MLRRFQIHGLVLCVVVAVALVPPSASSQTCAPLDNGHLADVFYQGTAIFWDPVIEYRQMVLTIGGPCEDIVKVFGPNDQISFDLREIERVTDGTYTWELRRESSIDEGIQQELQSARGSGEEDALWWSYFQAGKIPAGPYVDSASFTVVGGEIMDPNEGGEKRAALSGDAQASVLASAAAGFEASGPGSAPSGGNTLATKDTVLTNANGVIRNSLCVGFDCANNNTYSDTTILLRENNTRIKFDDTSTINSFPRNDWEIEANSNLNGGASYLGFNDCGQSSGGGCATDLVFAVEAGVRPKALYVESDGDVGFGTANPVVRLHTIDGDTPALRLEQDGSSGFAPQTWDVAGNETSFFVRDATNGSTLPFRIRPGASSNSLVIDTDDDVGIGVLSPDTRLHVRATDGSAAIKVEETNGTATQRIMISVINNGPPQTEMTDSNSGVTWRFGQNSSGDFVINDTADLGTAEMRITTGGTVFVNGGQVHPDYVFEPEYPLMPLGELERFVRENRHLPNVQSARDRQRQGGVNITELPLQLLEKVEELTLYTIEQEKRIDDLTRQNAELVKLLHELRADLPR